MPRTQIPNIAVALYGLYKDSGFSMAGAVAYGFVISFFPFCIFLAAMAGMIGGQELATIAIDYLFQSVPRSVAEVLAPEVHEVMGRGRFDLLTIGGALSLFFATSAIEYLRAALNTAYRVKETRPYPVCIAQSCLFVIVSAASMLVFTSGVVVLPAISSQLGPDALNRLINTDLFGVAVRFGIVTVVVALQLFAYHLWLVAGKRRLGDVWPGILVSVILLLVTAGLFSLYLQYTNYARFYAGLANIMVVLIFFQVTATIIILGAEINRGLAELKVRKLMLDQQDAMVPGQNNV
jgi:membrane protein